MKVYVVFLSRGSGDYSAPVAVYEKETDAERHRVELGLSGRRHDYEVRDHYVAKRTVEELLDEAVALLAAPGEAERALRFYAELSRYKTRE